MTLSYAKRDRDERVGKDGDSKPELLRNDSDDQLQDSSEPPVVARLA